LISSARTNVDEHGAELDLEALRPRGIDARADDVRGHEVRGELHPRKVAADDGRERPDGQGLRDAGHALEQAVALRQQRHHQLLHHVLLADDDPLHLADRVAQQACGPGDVARQIGLVDRRCAHAVTPSGSVVTRAQR